MDKKLVRLLLAEDNPDDAELILRRLRSAGFTVEYDRVDNEADFLGKLDPAIDIILSDYAMPQFTGTRALELLKKSDLDIPFILVSGTIGEETAVAAMRQGAADYLLKDRLVRLGQSVDHALAEKQRRDHHRRVQGKLDDLRQQHALILNSAGEGIYGVDLDGNVNFANPKAAELLGWKVEELLGKSAHATIHRTRNNGESDPTQDDPILDCLKGGSKRVTNDLICRKDGKSFRADYVCAPLKDETGNITGAIVTFEDVTEQFMAAARLKLQEQQYRLLFEINPSPMWVFDTKTLEILAVNDAAVAQYGYSREEFLKLNIEDLRPAEDMPEPTNAPADSSTRTMPHYSGQFRHKRKDASGIVVEIYSAPITWQSVSARIVTAIDITERKKAEEQLREQTEMINRAHDAIIIRNFDDQRITFWNEGAERLYGWTAQEAIGQRISDLLYPESEEYKQAAEHIGVAGEFQGELKQRTKEGREVIAAVRATLIRGNDGTPRAVLAINTDISEKKKLESQLLRGQRLESIGTLASGVAHDLNNVLTPILMAAGMIGGQSSPDQIESAMKLIDESARRGANIVNQVLTFARGVQGERVVIKPSHLIDEMADIARKTFPKSIEITTKYSEDLWSIQGDPTQLHQVLLNLSVNARDAMAEGGLLILGAENFMVDENYAAMTPDATAGPHVVLRTTDTGTGMPRAMIDKIFDPFFTTKQVGEGTGLGLSTALGIVKSHGGFISVYSEPLKGTTFKIFLPAAKETGGSKESEAPMELPSGNNELALVVDDEASILRVTQAILESRHYRVICAAEAPEALAILAKQMDDVDIVLTDIMLPHMDGVALIRAMKKMKPDLPFIASTGQGEQTRLSELQSLGVRHFLSKPYDAPKLLQTLHEALAKS